jgi:NodT family efflux transporter outer membrane factor (OMF) lipoprotein
MNYKCKKPYCYPLVIKIVLVNVIMLSTTACMKVGPDYVRPETETSSNWSTELRNGLNSGPVSLDVLANWWTILDDPVLSELINRMTKSNLDLREAKARVQEARARRQVSEADRFPTIEAGGSINHSNSSKESGGGTSRELYSAGFDASWELDIFGRIQRSIEAAEAELQATEEDLHDVLVSMLSEVALNYVDACTLQQQLSVAEENLEMQKETYDITQWRHEAGLTTALDVEQARFNMEQTRSNIPLLRTSLEQAKNRLAVLLGEQPGSLKQLLEEDRDIPKTPIEVAVGIPADTLRNRPDVRRAERKLAAQTAQVGVATAQAYPDFSLIGSIGLEALSPGSLLSTSARFLSLGGNTGWTIFDAGKIRQNIAAETALQEQALIQYEAAVLNALEEVENALVAFVEEQNRRQALQDATQSAQNAVVLSKQKYSSGLIDFIEVLDAQRSLLSIQDQLVTSNGEVTSNLIRLYKALGGGWTSMAQVDNEKN